MSRPATAEGLARLRNWHRREMEKADKRAADRRASSFTKKDAEEAKAFHAAAVETLRRCGAVW